MEIRNAYKILPGIHGDNGPWQKRVSMRAPLVCVRKEQDVVIWTRFIENR